MNLTKAIDYLQTDEMVKDDYLRYDDAMKTVLKAAAAWDEMSTCIGSFAKADDPSQLIYKVPDIIRKHYPKK